jgi:hypothetical protein
MSLIDLKKYKRFFAFGCSFTDYRWPTWADIVGKEFPGNYYNYGGGGASNPMIARAISEADLVYKLNKEDLVIIVWSDVCREERFRGFIFGTGSVLYDPEVLNSPFLHQLPLAYYKRDMTCIHMSSKFLDAIGLDYHMFSTVPLNKTEGSDPINIDDNTKTILSPVAKKLKENYLEAIYNGDWLNQPLVDLKCQGKIMHDAHPIPSLHLKFLNTVFSGLELSTGTLDYIKYYDNVLTTVPDITNTGHIHNKEFINHQRL